MRKRRFAGAGPRRVGDRLAPLLAVLALTAGMLPAACGGGSTRRSARPGPSPAAPAPGRFPAQVARVCAGVAPRLRATTRQLEAIGGQPGSAQAKIPRVAALLTEVSAEVRALRDGLARLTAPRPQRRAFIAFLDDLAALERTARSGAGALRSGTIGGLGQFGPRARQFGARARSVARDEARIPGLTACRSGGLGGGG